MGSRARVFLLSLIIIAVFLVAATKVVVTSAGMLGKNDLLLLATGDIMVHQRQLESSYRPETGTYEFDEWFTEIGPYLREGDLVVGNLETTLAGADLIYSGYPSFNSPESLAGSLKKAGFTLLSTANNHCFDRGEIGVLRTMEYLEKAGLKYFGTARSPEEREKHLFVTKNGITVVFLAYTYGLNGASRPLGKEYLVNLMDEKLIRSDIEKVRDKADLVVVSLHCGCEYSREPHSAHKAHAEKVIAWGADVILGSHPHVLQPVEFVQTDGGRTGVVVYSLGNFVSNQSLPYTDSGIVVQLLYVREQGQVNLKKVTGVPTWVHRYHDGGRLVYRVLPVAEAIQKYEKGNDPYLSADDYKTLQRVWQETTGHIQLEPYVRRKPAYYQGAAVRDLVRLLLQ